MKEFLLGFLFICFLSGCSKQDTPPALSAEKSIISFSFKKSVNEVLDKDYEGTISGTSISVSVPYGIDISQLKASYSVSAKATVKVGTTVQQSEATTNNFTNAVTFTITAEDNSTSSFTVTVSRSGNAPISSVNTTTGIELWSKNYLHTNLGDIVQSVHGGYWGDEFAAQAFYDFDKDGDKDLICGSINFDENQGIDLHFYRNNGGTFTKDQTVFTGSVPKLVHARQILLGDFDNNGWMDVVIAAHGYDKAPFPGEQQILLLNSNGAFSKKDLPLPKSNGEFTFNHSVSSGDIDNDGDIDLFFTNNMRLPANGIFLKNTGNANFEYDASIFPESAYSHKPCFSSALYDIDGDGYLDLLIAGHDRDANLTAEQGLKPTILWGSHTGKYTATLKTELPLVANYGVSNSIQVMDYNKDGKTDILIGKTGDGASGSLPFYTGYYLQLVKNNGSRSFSDVSSSIGSNATTTGGWIVWFLPQDVDGDGDIDITTADKWYNLSWKNNGGVYTKQ